MTSKDREDKNNSNLNFTPQKNYSPELDLTALKVVSIINDANISNDEKKDAVWLVLNKQ